MEILQSALLNLSFSPRVHSKVLKNFGMNKAAFFVSPNGASVTNPDAGSTLDVFLFNFRTAIFNPQPARTGEWQRIKPFVYAKRFGEPSRAGDSFYSANQDCG